MPDQYIFASAIPVARFFEGGRFECAQEQRDYQWQPEQVTRFTEDLFANAARNANADADHRLPYFIGAVVMNSRDGAQHIYDGLQRTTTLTVLMAMLRDRLDDEDRPVADRLHAAIMDERDTARLVLPPVDHTLATEIQPRGSTRKRIAGGSRFGRRVALERNQTAIRNILKTKTTLELVRLAEGVLDETVIAVLRVQDESLARLVFDSINSTGLKLEPHDLIKSRFIQFSKDESDAATLVETWDTVRDTVFKDFDEFVADLMVYTRPDTPHDTPQAQLGRLLDWAQARHHDREDGIHPWLGSVAKYVANDWSLINTVAKAGQVGQRDDLRPLLPVWAIYGYEWRPFAVSLMAKSRRRYTRMSKRQRETEQATWRAKVFDTLQKRAMALQLARISPERRARIFKNAIFDHRNQRNPFDHALVFDEVMLNRIRRTLRTPIPDATFRRNLLKWYEAQGRRDLGPIKARGRDRPTVEHILPANPKPDSGWTEKFPDAGERFTLTDSLGNLILVPEAINFEMDRGSFQEKRAVIEAHSGVMETMKLVDDAMREADWTPHVVRARADRVGQAIWDALELPGAPDFLQPLNDEEEPDIEDPSARDEPDLDTGDEDADDETD